MITSINFKYTFFALTLSFLLVGCKKEKKTESAEYYFKDSNVQELCNAISNSEMDKLDKIISNKKTNLNAVGKESITPLMWAMGKGNKKAFLRLLKAGANPNYVGEGKYGSVIIFATCFMKDSYFLETALKNGGNPNLLDCYKTPIVHAITYNNDLNNIKILIANGADVNYGGDGQSPPIFCANDLSKYDIVIYLLKNGADYSKKDRFGNDLKSCLKENLDNPSLALHGKWLVNVNKVVDFLEKKGIDVKELRELIKKGTRKNNVESDD